MYWPPVYLIPIAHACSHRGEAAEGCLMFGCSRSWWEAGRLKVLAFASHLFPSTFPRVGEKTFVSCVLLKSPCCPLRAYLQASRCSGPERASLSRWRREQIPVGEEGRGGGTEAVPNAFLLGCGQSAVPPGPSPAFKAAQGHRSFEGLSPSVCLSVLSVCLSLTQPNTEQAVAGVFLTTVDSKPLPPAPGPRWWNTRQSLWPIPSLLVTKHFPPHLRKCRHCSSFHHPQQWFTAGPQISAMGRGQF